MLAIRDLTIEYTQAGYVVRPIADLQVDVPDGELAILLGPSGSGKTTLLSCIAALLRPAAGRIQVAGTEVTALNGQELQRYRRHTVGIVFQAFNLVASLTARENVAAPLFLTGVGRRAALRRADELLERVALAERADHRPAQLSGGQQQRVAIARALVRDPPLILADEPTAHLDHVQVEEVLHLIRDLAGPGRVVVVATHDDRFNPLADRVIDLTPRAAADDGAPRTRDYAAGEVVFEQGDPSDRVYVVDAGRVEVFRRRPEGGDHVLTTLGPGQWFGELGPMIGLPRSASVRAAEPSTLSALTLQEFRRRRAQA